MEDESAAQTIEAQRQLQEEILEDLGQLVSELKDKSLQAREAVKDDTAVLESTASVLDLNQAKIDENNERLRQQVRSMRGSTCMTWLMLFVVCVLFVFTFVFMKTFRKQRPLPPPVPPSLPPVTMPDEVPPLPPLRPEEAARPLVRAEDDLYDLPTEEVPLPPVRADDDLYDLPTEEAQLPPVQSDEDVYDLPTLTD